MKLDDHSADLPARHAARRVLDAFYLEGQVLSEDEYAPLRDAMSRPAVLLLGCPDERDGCAAVTEFFHRHDADILCCDQHRDLGMLLMRLEWQWRSGVSGSAALTRRFAPVADELQAKWRIGLPHPRPRVAIFVSRPLHCLDELLSQSRRGALACDIALIVSNHPDARSLAAAHEVPFYEYSVGPDNKAEVERRQLELLRRQRIDLVVLARYMQVLSPNFVQAYRHRIINVHHSLLPAFSGPKPYQRAFERGVRVIGATSHYVTENLDKGPIIEQEAARVPARARLEDFLALGRELEKSALLRAVRWHVDHRILVYGGKTVVFERVETDTALERSPLGRASLEGERSRSGTALQARDLLQPN